MDVLILAEDAPGAIGRSYAAAFASLGARVERFCLRRAEALALPGASSRVGRRLLHRAAVREVNRRVRAHVRGRKADLVLVVKGEQLSAETVAAVREHVGAPVVNFFPDDPFSTTRSNRMAFGERVLGAYDVCFTFARHLIARYQSAGAAHVEYLPFARDPELHGPVERTEPPEFDIVFGGNLDAGRIAWLEVLHDYRLAVFGERTREALAPGSPLRSACFFPAAYGSALAQSLARGAISVNIMRPQNEGSHNMRSFESPACGVFTLSQRTPELVDLFREDEEIACFGSQAELRAKVAHWLARPAERAAIAEAGFRRVEQDTYRVRAETILCATGLR